MRKRDKSDLARWISMAENFTNTKKPASAGFFVLVEYFRHLFEAPTPEMIEPIFYGLLNQHLL